MQREAKKGWPSCAMSVTKADRNVHLPENEVLGCSGASQLLEGGQHEPAWSSNHSIFWEHSNVAKSGI